MKKIIGAVILGLLKWLQLFTLFSSFCMLAMTKNLIFLVPILLIIILTGKIDEVISKAFGLPVGTPSRERRRRPNGNGFRRDDIAERYVLGLPPFDRR